MTKSELGEFIRKSVPLTESMKLTVEEISDFSVRIGVPFEPNTNHYGTAFGGSISIMGIVAGWALLHSKISDDKIVCRLAIGESRIKFIRPASSDFYAVCNTLNEANWKDFISEFLSVGRASIKLTTEVRSGDDVIAVQEGMYFALPR